MIARRSIIKGLAALVAAPAIVKVADLMPINAGLVPDFTIVGNGVSLRELIAYKYNVDRRSIDVLYGSKSLQLGDVVTMGHMDAVHQSLHRGDSAFPRGSQYDHLFAANGMKIGDILRIRLPNDYAVSDGPKLIVANAPPTVPDKLALAAAAVVAAPLVLAKPVTRRFWAR